MTTYEAIAIVIATLYIAWLTYRLRKERKRRSEKLAEDLKKIFRDSKWRKK